MNITEDEEIVSYSTAFFIKLGEVIKRTDKRFENKTMWPDYEIKKEPNFAKIRQHFLLKS